MFPPPTTMTSLISFRIIAVCRFAPVPAGKGLPGIIPFADQCDDTIGRYGTICQ